MESPAHYTKGSKQPIEFMEECMSPEAFEGFMVGNAIKYIMRYNYKDGITDLKKCADYVNRLIAFKEKENIGYSDAENTGIVSDIEPETPVKIVKEKAPKTATISVKKNVEGQGSDLF